MVPTSGSNKTRTVCVLPSGSATGSPLTPSQQRVCREGRTPGYVTLPNRAPITSPPQHTHTKHCGGLQTGYNFSVRIYQLTFSFVLISLDTRIL